MKIQISSETYEVPFVVLPLNERKKLVSELLSKGLTISTIAAELGASERTIGRYKNAEKIAAAPTTLPLLAAPQPSSEPNPSPKEQHPILIVW